MLGVRGGDLYALGILFRRHADQVRCLALRMTRDVSTADDIVQETFMRTLQYRHTFMGDARFTTWLYRIARNCVLTHLDRDRSRSSAEQAAGIEGREHLNVHEGAADDARARLELAMSRLPAEQYEVLVLSRYHGLRYHEIAEVCESTVSAIKVRVHRAIKTLRREFQALERLDDRLRSNNR